MKISSPKLGLLLILALIGGCTKKTFHEDKIFAGGKVVTADSLNRGQLLYTEYCMPCHGDKGDGNGVSAKGMVPPPRNFKLGIYKFGSVIAGELPHDEDMYRILKEGLHGTGMLPWDVSEKQMYNMVQYIKTFAPEVWEGKDKKLGEKVTLGKDPYGLAHKNAAIERGKEVYHIVASCQTCHRAYATKDELSAMNMKINGEPMTDFDDDMYKVKPQESDHGVKTTPPDFTWHFVRSATTVDEIALRLAAGVGGTSMPAWKDTIEDDEIWAVAHYVRYLMDLKGKPERKAFIDKLK